MIYLKYLPIEIINKIILYSCIVDKKRKNLLKNINRIRVKKDIEDYYLCYWGEESCFYNLKIDLIEWGQNNNYSQKILYNLEKKFYSKKFWDILSLRLSNYEFNDYMFWLKNNRLYYETI